MVIVDALRRCAPIALAAGLLASVAAQGARFGFEAVPPQPAPRVVSPQLERKIAEARSSGYWLVEEGEYLYRIARIFANAEDEVRPLVVELAQVNQLSLAPGPGSQLAVGSRIKLPARLVTGAPAPRPGKPIVPADSVAPSPQVSPPQASSPPASSPPASSPPVSPTPILPPLAAALPVAASAPPAAAYVDRLIGGGKEESREETIAPGDKDLTPGLRTWAAELRGESRDVSALGRTSSEGLILRFSRETEHYGDFSVLAQGAHIRPPKGDRQGERSSGNATIFQDNFALTSDYVANSSLGVARPMLPPWISTSYRVFLTTPLINGFSTVIASPDRELRFAAGALGDYASYGVQQFERIPGNTAMATYSERLPGEWLAGASVIAVHGNDVAPDRTTATLAAQQGFQLSPDGVKFQAALTDDGERAGWIDAQKRMGRLTHRLGAYSIDPDFRFGQSQSLRDSRGAYWRGDYRSAGNFYGAGVEYVQDNLRRDPTRGGNDSTGVFGNLVLRMDRLTQVGGGLSARDEQPRTPTGIARGVYSGNVFASRNSFLGTSRVDANGSFTRPDQGSAERTQVYNWNQDWNAFSSLSLNSLLSYSDESLSDRRVKRRTLSLGARGPALRDVNWDANVTFVDARSTQGGERNYNAGLSLDWNPQREWMVQLGWFRNVIQPGADNALAPFIRENVVQLNLRYEDSGGSPYPRVGGGAGRSGSGSVVGSVFYDENGDGRRQANERGVAGVVVVLDERQSATTDGDGRYKFSLVPAGRHRIRILLERVSLPWGLEEEAPREVNVDVRSDGRLDIGLTRIAP